MFQWLSLHTKYQTSIETCPFCSVFSVSEVGTNGLILHEFRFENRTFNFLINYLLTYVIFNKTRSKAEININTILASCVSHSSRTDERTGMAALEIVQR